MHTITMQARTNRYEVRQQPLCFSGYMAVDAMITATVQ